MISKQRHVTHPHLSELKEPSNQLVEEALGVREADVAHAHPQHRVVRLRRHRRACVDVVESVFASHSLELACLCFACVHRTETYP